MVYTLNIMIIPYKQSQKKWVIKSPNQWSPWPIVCERATCRSTCVWWFQLYEYKSFLDYVKSLLTTRPHCKTWPKSPVSTCRDASCDHFFPWGSGCRSRTISKILANLKSSSQIIDQKSCGWFPSHQDLVCQMISQGTQLRIPILALQPNGV